MSTSEVSQDVIVSPARKRAQLAHLAPFVEQIKEADQKVKLYIQHSLKHALKAGQLLTGVKKKVGHGGWLEWFNNAEFEFSERTAQRYMSVYQRWKELQTKVEQGANPTVLTDLTFTDALELLAKSERKPASKRLSQVLVAGEQMLEQAEPNQIEKGEATSAVPLPTTAVEPDQAACGVQTSSPIPDRILACVTEVLSANVEASKPKVEFLVVDQSNWPESTGSNRVFVYLPPVLERSDLHSSRLLARYLDGGIEESILVAPAFTSAPWFRLFRDYLRAFIGSQMNNYATAEPEHLVAIYLGRRPDRFYHAFQSIADIYLPFASSMLQQQ